MKKYSEMTPITRGLDKKYDVDVFNSSYANVRYGANPQQLMVIDSKYEANLPGLAFDYYGDMEMWRAILSFNGLNDPINDVVVGMTLALPDKNSVETHLTRQLDRIQATTLLL